MEIPLDQFEEYIDETILKRGLRYFKNGHVHDLEEVAPGEYEAMVVGTENYTVRMRVRNGVIAEHYCDCPYDMGPVCKHVVATIFYLLQDELNLKVKPPKTKSSSASAKPKRKTAATQADELLEKVPHEDLKRFVRERMLTNTSIRGLFLTTFSLQYGDGTGASAYAAQVKSILKSAIGRGYYVDAASAKLFEVHFSSLENTAESYVQQGDYRGAFLILTAILEAITSILERVDDSYGVVFSYFEVAFEKLNALIRPDLPEETRRMIFDYCLKAYDKGIYNSLDWSIKILKIASSIFRTEDERESIFHRIDGIDESKYDAEYAQMLKYEILLRSEDESAAQEYMLQHIDNPQIRHLYISNAFEAKEYESAISIAQAGVKHDLKKRPGLAGEWYDWLLKIAEAQNDSVHIAMYARILLIDYSYHKHKRDYYHILRCHIAPEKWNGYVEEIIRDIKAKSYSYDSHLVSKIFIREGWWDRLLELVKEDPELRTIHAYEEYLAPHFPDEIVELYSAAILAFLKNGISRKHYKAACQYIRRIIKLGAREKANAIIAHLRSEYSNRPALLEELERV